MRSRLATLNLRGNLIGLEGARILVGAKMSELEVIGLDEQRQLRIKQHLRGF